jgi:hypothetical protein
MSYRNKTYIVFDGDNDIWAYRYMRGWKAQEHLDFDFHDAHDLNTLTQLANETNVKRKLKERFASAKEIVVLVGEKTKNLYRFVRWELETALDLELPIIVVNLNGKRSIDPDLCPAILRGKDALHVSFNMKIIKKGLDDISTNIRHIQGAEGKDWHYPESTYRELGL